MAATHDQSVTPDQTPSEELQEILRRMLEDAEAISKTAEAQSELEGGKAVADLTSQEVWLSLHEYQEIITLRREWSGLFKVALITILVFEIGLTVLVGTGLLQFEDEWFLRIIISGGIAQILAMPLLVTQFLFSATSLGGLSKTLKKKEHK